MRRLLCPAALALLLCGGSLFAQIAPHPALPAPVPAGRPTIGLALEGGGALGLAHVGVLQWMEDHRIPVDRIAGTSMGSLVGGLYASGLTPVELRALATGNAFQSVFTLQTPYADASFRRRQDRRELPGALTAGLRHGFLLSNALIDDRGVDAFLATNMAAYNSSTLDFDRMPIPFRCVATDLNTLGPVVFSSGPLPSAVRASISIPGVFPPVVDSRGHALVDGGIMDNLPADIARNDLHADVVIAIHLDDGGAVGGVDTSSIVGVLNRAFSAGIYRNVQQSMKAADLVISIPVGAYSGTDYNKGGQLIHEGYLAAERNRAALLPYALAPDAWAAHLAARRARIHPQPGLLRAVRVEGGTPVARASATADVAQLEGKPIATNATLDALKPIQSNGDYAAGYETYLAAPPAPGATPAPDDALLVRLTRDPKGPPFLLLAPVIASATSNPQRVALDLRLIDQDLGGFGSELRASARLGTVSNLSGEYFRRLSTSGWYLQPMGAASRQPVYIWVNQKRVAERSQQDLSGGLEFGRTFSNTAQVAIQWRAQQTHWALVTGSGGGPAFSGAAQTGQLRVVIDHTQSSTISPHGWRLVATGGALYNAVDSANAPLAQLSFGATHSWRDANVFGIGTDVNTAFRANIADPFRFTLGGPLRLSASSFDEFRGTDTYLARAGYLRRLAALPTGLGQGLYATFAYEAGQVWSPEEHAILRQDGMVGLVGATPVGLLTVGFSAGDAGHRKLFLTLGRWF
jgi:NTE family protein